MRTIHGSQDHKPKDLTSLLTDVEDRADRILRSLYLLQQLDDEFRAIQKALEQQDCIDLIRSHTEKMQADLEVVGKKSELLGDDRISEWINSSRDDTEKVNRQRHEKRLTKKMEGLQKKMAEAKRKYDEQENGEECASAKM